MQSLWSLAVEEHFYFFLPVLTYFLPAKKLPWILLVIMSLGIGIKIIGTYVKLVYQPLETWMRIPTFTYGVLLNFEQKRTLYSLFFLVWIVILAFFGFPIVGTKS